MKLLRTIRLDPSDTFVFERAADPGEWAVSGVFMFAHADPDALDGKSRAAFRGGFLGVASLGWSTLVQIVEASEADRDALVGTLGRQLHERLGAPDLAAARAAAEEEVAFAAHSATIPATPLLQCAAPSRTARSARCFARCIRAARANRCAPSRSWRSRTKRKRTKTSTCSRWRSISKPIETQADLDEA